MLHYLVNFLYPPHCAACNVRLAVDSSRRLCARCRASIDPMPEPLCEVCGIPLTAVGSGARAANGADASGDTDSTEWCANCRLSPPHFTRARAVVRYHHDSNDAAGTLGLSDADASDTADETGDRSDAGHSVARAGGVVSLIIRRHKYGLDQSLSHALAECLGDQLPLGAADYDVIVAVPLHRARLRWRGFNQAALLAVEVGRRMERPVDLSSLVRVRETPPQTLQHRSERVKNLKRAFAVRRPARLASRSILLVDDVMTTGATADECARTLIAAGARRVDVLTLARAV